MAKDDIDVLLKPKALTNFQSYGDRQGQINHQQDNLLIKGNNLFVLYSLLPIYQGKVKLIYIDPPYNTGNDGFKYNDNFNHSTWLTFMKNRLEVARELLSDDGVIFVQCDDNEQAYLKVLMDEVFGRGEFVGSFPRKSASNRAMAKEFSILHDYIFVFKKSKKASLIGKEKNTDNYKNPDNDPNGKWTTSNPSMSGSKNFFDIINPYTNQIDKPPKGRGWAFTEKKMQKMIDEKIFIFKKEYKENQRGFYIKKYLKDVSTNSLVNSLELLDNSVLNQVATKNDISLDFSNPKPEALLERIIQISTKPGDLVLDFFAGSGTTAAVACKMGRRFIAIEQMSYINTITKVRLQKVLEGEQGGVSKNHNWQGGGSFCYFELAKHNEKAKEQILSCQNSDNLKALFGELYHKYFLNYTINAKLFFEGQNSPSIVESIQFNELSLEQQQEIFCKMLDLNQMYILASEAEDVVYDLSAQDIALTKQFYAI